jgi:hypothetical protein
VIVQGSPPSSGDTNEEVLEWFADKESGIKVAVLLATLSVIALAWWFGSLWRRMSRAEGGDHRLSVVALVGLVGSGALFTTSTAVLTTVAIQVDEVSADAAKFFYVLSTALLATAGAFVVTHLGATNVLSLRNGFLPRWVSFIGLLSAALFLGSILGTTTDDDVVMFFGFGGFIVWMIWILGVSVHMWRTADAN